MGRLLAVVLVAGLAACGPAPEPPVYRGPTQNYAPVETPAQKAADAAIPPPTDQERWADCAGERIRALEDGVTEPRRIAGQIRDLCQRYYAQGDGQDLDNIVDAIWRLRQSRQGRQPTKPQQASDGGLPVAWVACVEWFLRYEAVDDYPVEVVARAAASHCRQHYKGPSGQDVQMIGIVVAKNRATPRGPIIGPAQPLPPVDKRV